MEFTQSTATLADTPYGKIVHGDPVRIFERTVGASQTLLAGAPVGILSNGQFVGLTSTQQVDLLSGTGSATTFDLESANVDPATVNVLVGTAPVYAFTISKGTGTAGVDQIVFATAPASGSSNVSVRYMETSSACVGILMEDCTTGVGVTKSKPILQAGAVKLAALASPPASWKVGQVIGQLILV